jgi:hypothetical protein
MFSLVKALSSDEAVTGEKETEVAAPQAEAQKA